MALGRGKSNGAGRGRLLPPLLHTFLRPELLSAPREGFWPHSLDFLPQEAGSLWPL